MPNVKVVVGIVALAILVVAIANFTWLLGTNLAFQQQINKQITLEKEAQSILKLAKDGMKIAKDYDALVQASALGDDAIRLLQERNKQLTEEVQKLKVSKENEPALEMLVKALNLQNKYLAITRDKSIKDNGKTHELYKSAVEAFNWIPNLVFKP